MAKQQLYAIGIIYCDNTVMFVTSVGERHTAKWEAGKEAMYFSKSVAMDMCQGFAWNGIAAMPILKQDFIDLRNGIDITKKNETCL